MFPRNDKTLALIAWLLFILAALTLLGALDFACIATHAKKEDLGDLSNRAQFASGTIGILVGAATVFLLFATFLIQQLQINSQQRELRETNERIERDSKQAAIHAFERTFFELLRLHHQLVIGVSVHDRKSTTMYEGRACYEYIYAEFLDPDFIYKGIPHRPLTAADRYEILFETYHPQLAHYFRNLFHVFLFIDGTSIEDETKYTKIACAQLSSPELLLFFYNGISTYGRKRFKGLIEQYALLQNLDTDKLLHRSDKNEYLPSAYDEK